ncbi:helix-turn-helix domain-containing protein [Salinactinospora qingdaonensis]|uniref:HTH cro/C1-type domain-containing protein n=1 Tax=Salinactinospora qingdaonensis TaxID=702744 RepID=A0ABP7FJU1_9ACTN
MDETTSIGPTLRSRREQLGWTQEYLAERSGLSTDYIGRIERGTRTASLQTIMRLARALDCDPGDLTGKTNRVQPIGDSSVLAVRDAVYDPALLLPGPPEGEPTPPRELMRTVEKGYGAYFSGEFGALAAMVPRLLTQCRDARHAHGITPVAAPYAHAYDLAAALLVHTGKDDAALAAIERAVLTAREGNDEFRPVSFLGTYAWVLLHMGRYREAESLVVRAADDIAPRMSDTDEPRLAAWGGLMMQAAVVTATDHRSDQAETYLAAARSAAVRMPQEQRRYWISFGPTQVAVQSTHIHTTLDQPDKALKAARDVQPNDLLSIQYGRHLLDVAQSQVARRRTDEAMVTAAKAHELSPEWFRHQRVADAVVEEIRRRKARPPEPLAAMLTTLRGN